ncbi:MAG: hypothetical protein ACI9LG_001693, partial [Moritella dasanensis]
LKNSQGLISHIQMGLQIGLMLSLDNSLPEGKAAHDAMSLCRQAKFGQILCSDKVKSILESYINFEALAQHDRIDSTQFNKPNALYSLVGERQSEAFGFLRRTQKHWAFVGRETELSQLENMLVQVKPNDTNKKHLVDQNKPLAPVVKLAHIHGEAGIGKSRIVFELRTRAPHRDCLVAQCLPEHQNNALYPILNLLKFKYSLVGLSDKLSLMYLRNAIELTSLNHEEQTQGLLVLAAWLNFDIDGIDEGEESLSNLSPALQKQRLFAVLCHLFCQTNYQMIDNESKPYLYIFEDLHWSDPTSQEFIQCLIQSHEFKRGQHAWINTSRQPLPEALADIPFITIMVDKLEKSQTQAFINLLFDGQTLATGLNDLILERTDGIPLFIEELVSSLKNQNLIHKVNGIFDFIDHETQSQVPITLRDSLQQRLDGLSFAKDTAQLAATIGRTFDYDLLVATSSKDEAQIQSDLDELIKAELVFQQRKIDGDSYIFKHALVRDAAYESQTHNLLTESHRKLVSILENEQVKTINKTPLIYIGHLFKAGYVKKGFEKSVAIGTQLSIDGHFIYSMNMTEHSLNNLHLITPDERPRYEADLLLTYSMLLMTVKGFGSEEYKRNIANIHLLPLEKLDVEMQCSIYFSLMINYTVLSKLKNGADKYSELYKIPVIPKQFQALVHFVNALIFHSSGDKIQGINEYHQAKIKYDLASETDLETCKDNYRKHIPYDLLTAIHMHHALALLESEELMVTENNPLLLAANKITFNSREENLTSNIVSAKNQLLMSGYAAEQANDPHTMAYFYVMKSQFYYYLKDYPLMKKNAQLAKDIATENNVVTWKSLATFLLGWTQFNNDDQVEGLVLMQNGYAEWSKAGAISHRAWLLALMAQSYAKIGSNNKSQDLMKESLNILEKHGEKRFQFDIYAIEKELTVQYCC